MNVIKPTLQVAEEPVTEVTLPIADKRISQRVVSVDWMRGQAGGALSDRSIS
jgi:hypothetical protein